MSQASKQPDEDNKTAARFSGGDLYWRFGLAVFLLAFATYWALNAKPGSDMERRPPWSLAFWIHPLEWNTEARKPMLKGGFHAVATVGDNADGWVYFGSDSGFVIRRRLNDEIWDTVPLPKALSNVQDTAETSPSGVGAP